MGGKTKQDATAQIRDRAHALWEQEGYPVGRDLDHWLRAEAQIAEETNGSAQRTAQRAPRAQTTGKRATAKSASASAKAPTSKSATRKTTKRTTRSKKDGK